MTDFQKWMRFSQLIPRSISEIMCCDPDSRAYVSLNTLAMDLHIKPREMDNHITKTVIPNTDGFGFKKYDSESDYDIYFDGFIKLVIFSYNRKSADIKLAFIDDLIDFYEIKDASCEIIQQANQ